MDVLCLVLARSTGLWGRGLSSAATFGLIRLAVVILVSVCLSELNKFIEGGHGRFPFIDWVLI